MPDEKRLSQKPRGASDNRASAVNLLERATSLRPPLRLGIASVKWLDHGALLAMNTASGRSGDTEGGFQLCRIELNKLPHAMAAPRLPNTGVL